MIWLIIIYLLSACYNYWWIRTAHSPVGKYLTCNIWSSDIFFTITPFFNTIIAIQLFFESPYKHTDESKNLFWNKFFGIKR